MEHYDLHLKQMEKDTCEKCGKYTWVERHHVLPQSTFGEKGETVKLCPTCHTDFHQHFGQENLKNEDMAFQFYTFWKWLCGLSAVLLLIWFAAKNF